MTLRFLLFFVIASVGNAKVDFQMAIVDGKARFALSRHHLTYFLESDVKILGRRASVGIDLNNKHKTVSLTIDGGKQADI